MATVLVCAVGAGPVVAGHRGRPRGVRAAGRGQPRGGREVRRSGHPRPDRARPALGPSPGTVPARHRGYPVGLDRDHRPGGRPGSAELELLEAGANAILRLPASPEWDRRLARLAQVSLRRKARVAVHLKVEASLGPAEEPFTADTLDLSETGMLVECGWPLELGSEVDFALQLPGPPGLLSGRARVMRLAAHHRYGLEFTDLGGEEYERLRAFVEEEGSGAPAGAPGSTPAAHRTRVAHESLPARVQVSGPRGRGRARLTCSRRLGVGHDPGHRTVTAGMVGAQENCMRGLTTRACRRFRRTIRKSPISRPR